MGFVRIKYLNVAEDEQPTPTDTQFDDSDPGCPQTMAAPPKPPFKPTATVIANGYTDQEGRDLAEKGGNTTVQQLVLALDVIVGLFEDQGVTCAVMGGLAPNFRGSTRDTHDVDITAACDMHTLRQACLSHPRLKVPIGPGLGVMRVFVHVGPKYGESVAEKWVQVDIILRGINPHSSERPGLTY
ncbi:hypothetical protein V8F06_005756 [Rhypophila decipiens]